MYNSYNIENNNCFHYVSRELKDPFFLLSEVSLTNLIRLQNYLKNEWIETNERKKNNIVLFYKHNKSTPFHIGIVENEYYLRHLEDSKMGVKYEPFSLFEVNSFKMYEKKVHI